jgi:hypothetical protein
VSSDPRAPQLRVHMETESDALRRGARAVSGAVGAS